MKRIQYIISAVLVIGLIFAGFPQFCPEDSDQNTRIDLGDAIQQVRDLAESVSHPENFTGNLGRAISTLTVLAGIKTVIKSNLGEESLNTPLAPILFYATSSYAFPIIPKFISQITECTNLYKFIASAPILPPPRLV